MPKTVKSDVESNVADTQPDTRPDDQLELTEVSSIEKDSASVIPENIYMSIKKLPGGYIIERIDVSGGGVVERMFFSDYVAAINYVNSTFNLTEEFELKILPENVYAIEKNSDNYLVHIKLDSFIVKHLAALNNFLVG